MHCARNESVGRQLTEGLRQHPDLVNKAVGIDDRADLAIAVLVTIGYTDSVAPHPGRRPRAEMVFSERYPG
ncbi:hypothetical protein ACWDYH_19430 [Nocardia goodfellowii]